MPRLIVLVEKDENGKVWDYAFTASEWKSIRKSTSPLIIHKYNFDETACESTPPVSATKDLVVMGVIPQEEVIIRQVIKKSK